MKSKSNSKKLLTDTLHQEYLSEFNSKFQCGYCKALLISSDQLNKPLKVLSRKKGIGVECDSEPIIETIQFLYERDKVYHMFSTLIPGVLYNIEPVNANQQVYHLLRCEKCEQIIGKYFIGSGQYEEKHCFPKTSIEVIEDLTVEEMKTRIVEIREKRMEIDGSILKLMKKVLRKITKTKMLIQGYDEQYEYINRNIDYLKGTTLTLNH